MLACYVLPVFMRRLFRLYWSGFAPFFTKSIREGEILDSFSIFFFYFATRNLTHAVRWSSWKHLNYLILFPPLHFTFFKAIFVNIACELAHFWRTVFFRFEQFDSCAKFLVTVGGDRDDATAGNSLHQKTCFLLGTSLLKTIRYNSFQPAPTPTP